MEKIFVQLNERSYPIIFSRKLFNKKYNHNQLNSKDRVMIVTDDQVMVFHLNELINRLFEIGIKADYVIVPKGEKSKSIIMLDKIFTNLLEKSYGRNTTIIAFGGGVIGDLAGFAAASYQRGVKLIQIPTTLLSQVDSSVGGKTGINHILGKNMIGAFYQPVSVLINFNYLKTLSTRELSSGLAEVIKYGIAFDNDFFYWIEKNIKKILSLDYRTLLHCVRTCCEIKAKVVSTDEKEKGIRGLLNLGHTYGHAIESYMGYGKWLHGEAISAGIMMSLETAKQINKFKNLEDAKNRIKSLFIESGLPIKGPKEMKPESYLPYMMRDKKAISGKICLVLPIKIGEAKIFKDIENKIVLNSIKKCQNE